MASSAEVPTQNRRREMPEGTNLGYRLAKLRDRAGRLGLRDNPRRRSNASSKIAYFQLNSAKLRMGVLVEGEREIDGVIGQNAFRRDSFCQAPSHGIKSHGFTLHLLDAEFYMFFLDRLWRREHTKVAGNEHRLPI